MTKGTATGGGAAVAHYLDSYHSERLSSDGPDTRTKPEMRDALQDVYDIAVMRAPKNRPDRLRGYLASPSRVLILGSYCGGGNPGCADDAPCMACLELCNTADVERTADLVGIRSHPDRDLSASVPPLRWYNTQSQVVSDAFGMKGFYRLAKDTDGGWSMMKPGPTGLILTEGIETCAEGKRLAETDRAERIRNEYQS